MKLLQATLMGAIALAGLGFFAQKAAAAPPKVVICHIPPGNPSNFHTIIVSKSAVPAHLQHGDAKGVCDFDDDGDNDDTWSMVTICHIPPGNPGNAHTITVGAPAVDAHIAHGDTFGPCGGDDGGDDVPTDDG